MQKGFSAVYAVVGVLAIFVIAGGAFYAGKLTNQPTETSQEQEKTTTGVLLNTQKTTEVPQLTNTMPSPTSDKTANWKVYTNSQYSYSLKYPSGWAYKLGKGPAQVVFETNTKNLETAVEGGAVVVTVSNTAVKPAIQSDGRNKIIESKQITIGGQTAEQATIADAGTNEVSYIQSAVIYNGKTYYFNLHKLDQRPVYDAMLSTFKFN